MNYGCFYDGVTCKKSLAPDQEPPGGAPRFQSTGPRHGNSWEKRNWGPFIACASSPLKPTKLGVVPIDLGVLPPLIVSPFVWWLERDHNNRNTLTLDSGFPMFPL